MMAPSPDQGGQKYEKRVKISTPTSSGSTVRAHRSGI